MAIQFDGINDYAEHGTAVTLGDFSIAFMLRTTTASTLVIPIGTADDGDSAVFQIQLNTDNTESGAANKVNTFIRSDAGGTARDRAEFTNSGVFDGTWRRHVFTRTGNTWAYHVSDSAQTLTFTADAGFNGIGTGSIAFQYPFFFGARNLRTVADGHADCDIADIGIYSAVLSAANITALETNSIETVDTGNRIRGWKTIGLTELDASDSLTLNNGASLITGPSLGSGSIVPIIMNLTDHQSGGTL